MTNRSDGKKISQFIGITELADSDYLTLISSGVNYKMLVSDFKSAIGVPGWAPKGLISMQGNTTDTNIVTQSVPVLVAGTWNSQIVEGFSASAAGRLTYTLSTTRDFIVDACVTMRAVATSSQTALYVAKNGVVISESKMFGVGSAGWEHEVATNWIVSLSEGDYVEIFVANLSNTVGIEVNSAVVRITGCL